MLLNICIPTYNRPEKVERLLDFLYEEFIMIDTNKFNIEFIVGDNSENTNTKIITLNSKLFKINKLKYIKNEINLGLVGNVINLAKSSNGKFTWIIGDDDVYYPNILETLLDTILNNHYSFVFLNHRAYIENKKGQTGFETAINLSKPTVYQDGKEMLLDIWSESKASLMFISACIYRTDILHKCIKNINIKLNLAFPLYMSFYCGSKGECAVIKKIYIDNIWGDTSWTKQKSDVLIEYVPLILLDIQKLGYNKLRVWYYLILYILPKWKAVLGRLKRKIYKT